MAEPVIAPDPTQPTPTTSAVEPAVNPLVAPRASPLAVLGVPDNTVLGGSGGTGASPVIQFLTDQLAAKAGLKFPERDPMTGATAAPLRPFAEAVQRVYPGNRPLPGLAPEFEGGLDALPQAGQTPLDVNLGSLIYALRSGLDESPIGSLLRFDQMRRAVSTYVEPGYDIFNDRRITEAGYGNQMYLFTGSRSRDMTDWMLQRYQDKARTAEYVDHMGLPGGVAKFAGGILGDPLTYLPTTVAFKSLSLAGKLAEGTLSGAELGLISRARAVAYGALTDAVANVSITAGTHVMGRLAQHYGDPTSQLDDVLDSLFVPVALAGSSQLLSSAFSRWTAHGIKDEVRDASFLRGTPPSGARYVPHDFVGPVIHPDDAAASALVSRYDDATRRMERTYPGSSPEARANLPGDSDYAQGKFGKQSVPPYNGVSRDGQFPPGALATNYGPLRAAEAATDPATEALLRHSVPGEGSAGAALNPASQVYRREVLLAQGRMAPTGIGLEHLPLDPVSRTFQGMSVAAMQLVSDLVSPGGRLTVGNLAGRTMGIRAPVEQLIEANWGKPAVDLVRRQHDSWHEYRKALAEAGGQAGIQPVNYTTRTDMSRLGYEVGQAALGLFDRGDPGINFAAFRNRVAKALNNGDVDMLTDSATKYVNREAQAQRSFYSRTRDKANELGLFDEAYQKSKDLAQSELVALKKEADDIARKSRLEGWDPERTRAAEEALITRTEDAQFRMRQTEKQLENLRANGPSLNGTATSYRPRLWDVGELTRLEGDFVTEISDWLKMKSGGTLDTPEAVRQAKEIHGLVSRQNPVYDRGDMAALFQSVASPSSAMARSLTIPDKMIEKYLINDSETLLRYHAKQMGTAIEMKQRFGSLDLKEQIAEIEQEYRGLMKRSADEAASPPGDAYKAQFEKAEGVPWSALPPVEDLQKMSKGAIEDMQVLRDRLYGTHGAAADPHAWDSRTIRMAKQFANITLLGMSGVSSLGDFVRPLMTEGLDAMYGYGLRTLMSDARGTILNLARKDMELAGTGMDLMNNVRALQAADTGDVFGSRGRLEHALGQANEWFFVANGLNQLTQWSKRWSSIMIQGRMNAALEDFMQAGNFADRTDLARFASFNIDETMAAKIALQLKIYGKDFGNIKLANLGAWRDETAAELYKSMLNQSINRTVVTPGLGDRANWMSTELGSLVSQYKAWGVANLNRSLVSGLQEGGNQFWYGAAAAVGFAILLNEVRSRLFYDHSSFDRPATAVIADGVDRSSILGWFSDANRAIETLSGNRLGFKPLMGAAHPHSVDIPQAAGTVLGPAAGQAVRAGSVLNDFIRDHPTAKTYSNWRTLLPGNTLPYLDPVYDRMISDGNFRTGMQRSAQRQGKEAPP